MCWSVANCLAGRWKFEIYAVPSHKRSGMEIEMNLVLNKHFAQTDKWIRRGICLLLIGAILVNIKSIFADFGIDMEYALVTSYRTLSGDRMFTEMWEPHQTSAFLVTFIMWIYHSVAGTWTGVVIFTHIVGALLGGCISFFVYKVLYKRIDSVIAAVISIFLLTFRPKETVFPEFSNMQVGFSVLLFLCLLLYLENQRQKGWLIAASITLSLQILSYPSCLIVYFFVVFILWNYVEKKLVNILVFTVSCLIQGVCYILFFLRRMSFNQFLSCAQNIVSADLSHSGVSMDIKSYFFFFNKGAVWFLACFAVTLLIVFIFMFYTKKRGHIYTKRGMRNFGLTILSVLVFISEVIRILIYRERLSYIVIFPFLLLFGIIGLKHCNSKERQIYMIGMLVSAGSFLATLMLTNLEFLSTLSYSVLAVTMSFVPIYRWFQTNKSANLLIIFCGLVIMHRGLSVTTLDGEFSSLLDLHGIVKSGPAAGIVNCYMGVYEIKCDMEDWEQYVTPGDHLLIVGPQLNSMSYMYTNVTISAPSVISTPTYDEMLLKYWEENPDKFPNVIAVSCWYGDLHIEEESWIYQWIQDEFQPSTYVDGRYWRFYRLEETTR